MDGRYFLVRMENFSVGPTFRKITQRLQLAHLFKNICHFVNLGFEKKTLCFLFFQVCDLICCFVTHHVSLHQSHCVRFHNMA